MSIKTRSTAASYIEAAVDGKKSGAVDVGNQKQITVAMSHDLLNQVEAAAKARNIGRAAFVRMALTKYLSDVD